MSKAAISGGVITVPSAMKEKLGGKFSLYVSDGRHVGTLVSKNGCAWGLGPVLRGHSAEPGDYLLIHFNVRDRKAQVRIGDEHVLESVAKQPEPAVREDGKVLMSLPEIPLGGPDSLLSGCRRHRRPLAHSSCGCAAPIASYRGHPITGFARQHSSEHAGGPIALLSAWRGS